MKQNHIIQIGLEEKFAQLIHAFAQGQGMASREIRQPKACFKLLQKAGPGIIILKLGKDLEQELNLLRQITWFYPEAKTIVLCDRDNPALVGLAWDLGAWYVFTPPLPWELLPELLLGLTTSQKSEQDSLSHALYD